MSHPVLTKYRTLKVVNDQATVEKMTAEMAKHSINIPNWAAHSPHAGRFIMYNHGVIAPGKVLEYVPDLKNEWPVATLYEDHPIFFSRHTLIAAREEIIGAIDTLLMSVPNTAAVKDLGRDGKLFLLPELGTAQLLDVLANFSGSDVRAL